jgi:chaperonin GroES
MLKLDKYLTLADGVESATNLTDRFSPEDLDRIGVYCVEGFKSDCDSRKEWVEKNRAGLDLAMQVTKTKTFPWPNCANVAFPLVTIAALQFHARAYPAIVGSKNLVKCDYAFDSSPEEKMRADMVSKYMSYQLLQEDTAWEEQHDRLLLNYSIIGCAFKKSYYSGKLRHNVSELVLAQDLVMDYYATSVETCRRKTHVYPIWKNDLLSGIRREKPIYHDVSKEAWFEKGGTQFDLHLNDGTQPPKRVEDLPFVALEQHVWLDLDNDGFEEPYVITVERDSQKVLRIVTRWDRAIDISRNAAGEIFQINSTEYFTKYGFIPSPDGSIYDLGFGRLLGPLNETVSSAINQLLDAGSMSVSAGGFLGRGAKVRSGDYSFSPFEWKRVDAMGDDLAKSIFPLPVREPSNVLFNLLSLLIEYTNRISGATDTLVGESVGQNTPAETSRSMVEQGMKIYSALFKRCWRSMKEELKKLFVLNAVYAPPRYAQLFAGDPNRIAPAADPTITSEAERLRKAIIVAERAAVVPGYDPAKVEENLLRAVGVDNWQEFYVGVDPSKQPKDPRIVVAELKFQQFQLDLQARQQEFVMTLMEERRMNNVEIVRVQAEVTKLMAEAEDARDNREIVRMQTALAALKTRDEAMRARVDQLIKVMEMESEPERRGVDTRTVRQLVGAPDDAGGASVPPQASAGVPGGMVAG